MKKLLFALPLLAFAAILSFCSKSDVKDELNAPNPGQTVENRALCTLVNNPANAAVEFTICGTNTNVQGCLSCIGEKKFGVEVTNGFINLPLQTPITISIRNSVPTALNLNAGGNTLGPINMPVANGCVRIHIDDNCNITQV